LAREITTLCGGAATLLARAAALAEAGEMRLAGHLADYALEAAPQDAAVREGVAATYERRAALPQIDANLEQIALKVTGVPAFDDDAARHNAIEKPFEFLGPSAGKMGTRSDEISWRF
jgi:hypothetical protein